MKNETILSYFKWNKIDPHVVTCSNFKLIIHLSVSYFQQKLHSFRVPASSVLSARKRWINWPQKIQTLVKSTSSVTTVNRKLSHIVMTVPLVRMHMA